MKAGRKNMKMASKEDDFSLHDDQSIMQVISLRGSNLIEVVDANGIKSLALIPAKFQKSFWIKRGNYVVVDESGREQAIESGSKIACIVPRVLYHDHVCALAKSSEWSTIFKTTSIHDSKAPLRRLTSEIGEGSDSEDGLPPLEANLNRNRPLELYSDSDSDLGSDPAS